MDLLRKLWDKGKTYARYVKDSVSKIVNTAFPQTESKIAFYAFMGFVVFLLAYVVALLDIGMWVGKYSLSGLIAAYVLANRFYPIGTFLLLTTAFLAAAYIYLRNIVNGNTGRGFTISDSNVYGSARDINMEELQQVADIVPKEQAMGTILGQLDTSETRLITSKPIANFNNNLLVLAPPGSGKTFCIVQNSIMQSIRRGESVITTDTKGELWAKTVEYARANGYIVRRFDLKNPKCSDGLDILAEMQADDIRAKIASSIIMKNTGNEKDIHASAEEALLTAVCLYQALNDAIPPEEKTIYNAFAMLFEGAGSLDVKFNSVKYDPKMRVAYDAYATFLQGSPNLRGNVITGLANRLNMLSSPAIRTMTSTPDIDLTLPGKQKCIYYCEMPDQHDAMRFLATLFFSFLLWDLTDYADAQMDQRLPVPVSIMIEEAYAVGELPTITNALSTVRSRGIGITLIAQGIAQFKILYGEEVTNTILNSCATFACLGSNTSDTAELFSWMAGDATVKVKTEQHTVGEGPITFGRNYSTGDGRQALYTGNDIRKIPFGRILIVWQRFDPIMAYTFGVDRHPEMLKGRLPKISANTTVPLEDKEARAFLRAMEEQRIMDYDAWIADGGDPWKDYGIPKPKYNGPSRKKKMPSITPYPELERMALEHSKQASIRSKENLLKELQREKPVPPEDEFEPIFIPDGFCWETVEMDEEPAPEPAKEPEAFTAETPDVSVCREEKSATPPHGATGQGRCANEGKDNVTLQKPPAVIPGADSRYAKRVQSVQSEPMQQPTGPKIKPPPLTPEQILADESMSGSAFGIPGEDNTVRRKAPSAFRTTPSLRRPAPKDQNEE